MRILLLFAHPGQKSFNHAVCARLRQSLRVHDLVEHDLYREQFDPILTQAEIRRRYSLDSLVQAHYRDLQQSGALIVVHPDWWGQPPAILKGWIDRVLRPGIAYEFEGPEFGRKKALPLLTGRRAAVFVTSDSRASHVQPLFDMMWRDRVFGFCGVETIGVEVFGDMHHASRQARDRFLDRVGALAQQLVAARGDGGGVGDETDSGSTSR